MAWVALAVYVTGMALAFGLRTWLHKRTTGDSGLRFNRPPFGSAQWWAQVLFLAAILLGFLAPILAGTGLVAPIAALDSTPLAVAGILVALIGVGGVLTAQSAMGNSWRIGVDTAERTELMTEGVFGLVRNPIFSAMIVVSVGLTAMVPSWLQLLALISLVTGIQLQVRVVEEPYLITAHGDRYTGYTQQAGRFIPGIGRRVAQ